MYDYICETPVVLRGIIENRKEITKEFVEYFKDKNIEQILMCLVQAPVIMQDFLPRIIWKSC